MDDMTIKNCRRCYEPPRREVVTKVGDKEVFKYACKCGVSGRAKTTERYARASWNKVNKQVTPVVKPVVVSPEVVNAQS